MAVTFQSGTLATPAVGTVIATDRVVSGGIGTEYQQVKIDVGPAGTSVLASYAAGTGLPVQGIGTFQALGTVQPLAGSVHVANTIPGTVQVLGSIQTVGTSQVLGSVQTVGTSQVLGTVQPLAGSAHIANTAAVLGSVSAQGYVAHGAAAAGNPVLVSAFGSSGTQAAVSDGQAVRLWSDLNGRLQIRGTIDSIGTIQALGSIQTVGTSQVLGSVQTVGTSQVLGSVQTVGTSQVLGTTQPLAGSVHLASNLPGGSVNAQGVIAHGAAIAGNPLLMSAFGSSGTQAAVSDGQLTRLWADLNGRLVIRGTIDSLVGTVGIAGGTAQVLGSVQAVGTTQTKEVRVAGATTSSVAATVGNIILLAANPSRFGAAFYLESGSALYLKLGSNAGTLDYTVQMQTLAYYEMPFNYTGTVSGIWQFAGGTVRVTEIV